MYSKGFLLIFKVKDNKKFQNAYLKYAYLLTQKSHGYKYDCIDEIDEN